MQNLMNINWSSGGVSESSGKSNEDATQIYSAKFTNPRKDFIIAGGSDKN